jgi:hypothetical protein
MRERFLEVYRLWSGAAWFEGRDVHGMDKVGEVRSNTKWCVALVGEVRFDTKWRTYGIGGL